MMQDGRRILLIDNSPNYLVVVAEFLEQMGYQVSTAESLEEARRVLQSVPIQLIVTDLRATDDSDDRDYSGLVFARDFTSAIPKIILTGYPVYQVVRQALAPHAGGVPPPAVDFVTKHEGLE